MKQREYPTPTNLEDFDMRKLDGLPKIEKNRCLLLLHSPEKFRELQTEQIMAQMGLRETDKKNPYSWEWFRDIAEHCLRRNNVSFDPADYKRNIIIRAFLTPDFKYIVDDIANKILTNGFLNAPVSYKEWTRSVLVSDFREATLNDNSAYKKLTKNEEGQEIQHIGEMETHSEVFKLETFANIFSVSREAYICDELEVLKNTPKLMGEAAAKTVEDTLWNVLASNPMMADGKTLLHADHGNIVSGTLNDSSFDLARSAMAFQKTNDVLMNLEPTHLLVPKALESIARKIVREQYPDGSVKVLASSHLDKISNKDWYLVSNVNPPIAIATLASQTTPRVNPMKSILATDTIEFKVVFDFCIFAAEHKSIVKGVGA